MLAEFSRLYAMDKLRAYQSTLTVSCDAASLKVIPISAPVLDGIFIQHSYGSTCHPTGDKFQDSVKEWSLLLRRVNMDMRKDLKFYTVIVQSRDVHAYVTTYQDFYGIYQEVSRYSQQAHDVVFNVVTTLIQRPNNVDTTSKQRCINGKTTSCAC